MTLQQIITEDGATAVAARLGYCREYMSQIKHGHRRPSFAVIARAAAAFGPARLDLWATVLQGADNARA